MNHNMINISYDDLVHQLRPAIWLQTALHHLSEIQNVVFYSMQRSADRSPCPVSPFTRLIQGMYEYDPVFARAHLRSHLIYDSDLLLPSERDLGMIKVAAKRVRETNDALKIPGPIQAIEIDFINLWNYKNQSDFFSIGSKITVPEAMKRLREFYRNEIMPVQSESRRFERARPEFALLLSAELEILAWARNTNYPNRTLHAEVNLIQSWWREMKRPIPARARLLTTLKPCKMCAGMIWDSCEDRASIDLVYDRFDPGPFGKSTIFNGRQYIDSRENI